MILFWFKTSIAASSMRVQCKSPNTLLGVIPLGSSTQTIPLRNIASVDTNIFLIAGLACMKDSALVGILFLVLANLTVDMVKKYESEKYRIQPSDRMKDMLEHYLAEHRRAVVAIVERHRGEERATLSFSRVSNLPDDLPDWIKAEASAKRRAAAVLLEAEGVAVDYTYLPEETD